MKSKAIDNLYDNIRKPVGSYGVLCKHCSSPLVHKRGKAQIIINGAIVKKQKWKCLNPKCGRTFT